jgi:hypothetical protein
LRVNLTAYGCEQERRAQPSDDVNERRDFQPQHLGLDPGRDHLKMPQLIVAGFGSNKSIFGPTETSIWCGCMMA